MKGAGNLKKLRTIKEDEALMVDKPSKKLDYEDVPCQKQKRKIHLFADTKAVSINSIERFVIMFQRKTKKSNNEKSFLSSVGS